MADEAAELIVNVSAKESVTAVLQRLESQLDQTNSVATRVAEALESKLGRAQAAAKNDALALAQAEARLQAASGNTAGAIDGLTAAIAKEEQGTLATIRAQTQLAQLQNKVSGQSASLSSGLGGVEGALSGVGTEASAAASYMGELGVSAGGSLTAMLGPAAAATAAIGALKGALDLAQASAKIDATRESFDKLAVSAGTTGDALLGSLREAAQGTVSDANLIQSANSGILLTGGKLATDLPRLLEIARASAQASGDDIGFVFDSLVKGIARGSPQIIDNAKITLDSAGAFDTYAKSIGKTSDQLTRAEQQQATLNAVLVAGDDIIKKTGGSANGNAASFARAGVAIENFKNSAGTAIANGLAPFADSIGQMGERTQQFSNFLSQLGSGTTQTAAQAAAAAAADAAYAAEIQRSGDVLAANRAFEAAHAASLQQSASAAAGAAAANAQLASVIPATATAINDGTIATNTGTAALQAHAAEYALVSAVTEQSVTVSLADAAAKQEVTAKTQLLTAETNAAASAFLTLNPSIDAGGVAALAAAGKIDPLLAQLIQARLRALEAANALIAFNNAANAKSVSATVAQQRSTGTGGRGDSSDAAEGNAAAAAQNAKIEAARRNQILQTGNATQIAALRQKEYNDAVKQYGAISPQAINAQTALTEAQTKGAKAAKVGAGGGGATKLTDQQKLNNSLLTDQENYEQKREDIVTQHAIDVEKIESEFATKVKAQQEANQLSQLQSQADFYDRLTSSALNKSKNKADKGALATIDAGYQQALAKAQQLSSQGNAKLAADYLSLKQKQSEQELDFAEKLSSAKEKKDKGEVSRLEAIQAIRRQAATEEERQLLEHGDANVNTRDQALGEADQKEIDAQDKVGLASDRAAERKITNATRSGKAIDDEQTKVGALADTYDRVAQARAGAAGTAPGATGSTSAPTPTPPTDKPPAASTPPAANAGGDVLGALNSIRSAVEAVEAAVKSSGKGVESSIGRIKLSAPGVN